MRQGLIEKNGNKYWYVNDQLHRIGGPAVEFAGGNFAASNREWFVYDRRHRIDGPAVEYVSGDNGWWVNDCNITNEVEAWLAENQYTWPFDKSTQVAFQLRFL